MDIKTLESFKLSDAVKFHDKLNPKIWVNGHLDPQVKKQLELIAEDFLTELGIRKPNVEDITISGSNAAYSYTPHSDIDLHILIDMSKLSNDEIYRELFNAKKRIYNDKHDIQIRGIPVELYIQDSNEPVISLGEYSILNDKWIKLPKKRRAHFDHKESKLKYDKLFDVIQTALQTKDIEKVEKTINKIYQYRQTGLDKAGEFSPENLAFKSVRSQGLIEKLFNLRDKLHSKKLSIESQNEDYDPNGIPPGPEFKPTMPKGTVRVDVSDVYDWYKLGQHISNMKGLGKHDFGKGPPSTILSFGDEDTEHEYIKDLEKTGLTTTDIDPFDPHQPKGMKRQKVDPTFNVNENKKQKIFELNIPQTLSFIKKAHGDQLYGTLPYWTHPRQVAIIGKKIFGEKFNSDAVKVAFLHDIVEDTNIGLDQLSKLEFDNKVIEAVKLLTKDKSISYIDNIKNIINSNNMYAIMVKYADNYVNYTGDKSTWDPKRREMAQRKYLASMKMLADKLNIKSIGENASGYIPNNKQKNDPRYKTALTVDVKPDTMRKDALKFGNKISRAGIPPTLKP